MRNLKLSGVPSHPPVETYDLKVRVIGRGGVYLPLIFVANDTSNRQSTNEDTLSLNKYFTTLKRTSFFCFGLG